MAAQYPAALVTTTQLPNNRADATATTTNHVADHNNLADELIAVEAELGVMPGSSVSTTVRSRFEELPIKRAAAASTANVAGTYANGTAGVGATKAVGGTTLSVDGVTIANNDRVLLKDQTTAFENGVYAATGVGTSVVLTRTIDADTSAKLSDCIVEVSAGTVNGDTQWRGTATLPTVGTTALPFRRGRPFYTPGAPRDPWTPGALTTQPVSQNMARADAVGTFTMATAATQYLIGGIVVPAGRTITNVNVIITTAQTPTISWFALARQSDRLVLAHTANSTGAETAAAVTARALTATFTSNYDVPVWVIWSHASATASACLSSPAGNAAANLVAPAVAATNGVTPTTTVPTDGTTVITAATTGVASIPFVWLT